MLVSRTKRGERAQRPSPTRHASPASPASLVERSEEGQQTLDMSNLLGPKPRIRSLMMFRSSAARGTDRAFEVCDGCAGGGTTLAAGEVGGGGGWGWG